jgi:GT2 family glycosyltransferase
MVKPKILAVIVLYEIHAEESSTYRSLLRALASANQTLSFSILLYDNSAQAQLPEQLPPNTSYIHATSNGGVSAAYNWALNQAKESHMDWLLTLDQDTELPESFIDRILPAIEEVADQSEIAAIVPQIMSGNRIFSPHFYVKGAWPRYFMNGFTGVPKQRVFAINSGSLLRVSSLLAVGGYSLEFWLDGSDHYIYRQFARRRWRVYVLGSLQLSHDLSQLSSSAPLSPNRLQLILDAESAFWDTQMSTFDGLMYTVVMVRHLLGQWRRRENPALRRLVAQNIVRRVVLSKDRRISEWRKSLSVESLGNRPGRGD